MIASCYRCLLLAVLLLVPWLSQAQIAIDVFGDPGSRETLWVYQGTVTFSGLDSYWVDHYNPSLPGSYNNPPYASLDVPTFSANLGNYTSEANHDDHWVAFTWSTITISGSLSGAVGISSMTYDSDGAGGDDLYWHLAQDHFFERGESLTYSGSGMMPVDITTFDSIPSFPFTFRDTTGPTPHSIEITFHDTSPVPESTSLSFLFLSSLFLSRRRR